MKRLILLSLVVVPSAALADPLRPELGVMIGGHAFSSTSELGTPDIDAAPTLGTGALVGIRAALPLPILRQRLAIEGELAIIPTSENIVGDSDMVYDLRAHLRLDLLTGKFKPFIVLGAGMQALRPSHPTPEMYDDVDPEYHWGIGARYAVRDDLDIRIDGRQLLVPDRTTNGSTFDYEISVGATWRFGHAEEPAPPPPVVEEPPPAPPPAPEAPPPPPPPPKIIKELAGIGFELDSAKLDINSGPILDHAYQILTETPDMTVEISGHTSSEGDAARNQQLSLARAETVKAYLVRKGINADRMTTVGHGSDIPIADNATEDGRRKNRRIEFHILSPK